MKPLYFITLACLLMANAFGVTAQSNEKLNPFLIRKPLPTLDEVNWQKCKAVPQNVAFDARPRHGLSRYRDGQIILLPSSPKSAFRIPENFFPIGYSHIKENCVSFAPGSQAIFLHQDHFVVSEENIPEMGKRQVFFVGRANMEPGELEAYVEMERRSFRLIAPFFPKPYAEQEKYWFFITHGLKVQNQKPNLARDHYRLFGGDGMAITTIERRWSHARMKELSLHRTAHYFNRYNSRNTNMATGDEFPLVTFNEAVASWFETVFMDNRRERRKRIVLTLHPRMQGFGGLKQVQSQTNFRGLGAEDRRYPEYVHYSWGPLVLLGLEQLLVLEDRQITVSDLVSSFYHGNEDDFMALVEKELSPENLTVFRSWLYGEVIPTPYLISALKLYDFN